jgi:hypothetical protein
MKFASWIPDKVIGIFNLHNTSGRILAPGSTQSVTELSSRNIFGRGGGDRCLGLTNLPPSYLDCLEIWEPQLSTDLRVCPALYRNCFTITFINKNQSEYLNHCQRNAVLPFIRVLGEILRKNCGSHAHAQIVV